MIKEYINKIQAGDCSSTEIMSWGDGVSGP